MAAATVETNVPMAESTPLTSTMTQSNDATNGRSDRHNDRRGWWWGRSKGGWDQEKPFDAYTTTTVTVQTSDSTPNDPSLLADNQPTDSPATDPTVTAQAAFPGKRGHHPCPFSRRYPLEEIADGQTHIPPEFAFYGPRGGFDPYDCRSRMWRQYFYSETGHLFGEFDF